MDVKEVSIWDTASGRSNGIYEHVYYRNNSFVLVNVKEKCTNVISLEMYM